MGPTLESMKTFLCFGALAALTLPACGATAPVDVAAEHASPSAAVPSLELGSDVLAVALGTEMRLIALDGSSTTVLAGDPFFAGVTGVDLIGASKFVLVRAYAAESPASGVRLAVIGSDGTVKWKEGFAASFAGGTSEAAGALAWQPSLSADGSVVVTDRASGVRTFALGGASGELSGYGPIGQAVGGYVPVATAWDQANPYTQTYAWWKMGQGRHLESAETITTSATDHGLAPVSFGDKLVRLERVGGGSVLQVRTRDAVATITLARTTTEASIVSPSNDEMFGGDRWLLVASGVQGRMVRVDVASRMAQTVDLVAPAGYRAFEACREDVPLGTSLRIDRDGRIYGVFRNDDRVAAFATVDGTQWTQIGGSFANVGGLEVDATRGTYTLRGHTEVYCFGAGPTFTSPSGADFVGDRTQIVRPSASTQIVVASKRGDLRADAGYTLSRSGRFGATWLVDSGVATLHVVDLESGADQIVATDSVGIRSAQPVWLWKP